MTKEKLLDAEVERLVAVYGAKAVREAAGRIGKLKRGRPSEPDYWGLKDTIEQDARDWLAGRDPCKLRSNKSIARSFVPAKAQHSPEATHDRIMKVLRNHRAAWIKCQAMWICEEQQPFTRYFEVAREVAEIPRYSKSMPSLLSVRLGDLERYRERFGEPPPEMTIRQIKQELLRPLPALKEATFAQLLSVGRQGGDKIEPD